MFKNQNVRPVGYSCLVTIAERNMLKQERDWFIAVQTITAQNKQRIKSGIQDATKCTPKSPQHPTFQMYNYRKRCVSRWTKPPNFWSWR